MLSKLYSDAVRFSTKKSSWLVRVSLLNSTGRLPAFLSSSFYLPDTQKCGFLTKRQPVSARSTFILDTQKPRVDEKSSSLGYKDVQDLLTDELAKVQLKIVEAYRRGVIRPPDPAKKSRSSEIKTTVAKVLIVGLTIYVILQLYKFPGAGFPKLLDSGTFSFAENADVTFSDVQGCDEVKQELQDVVEFLRNPEKFNRIGAKLPKGVLLVGPPGVGKTLLARAVSGEAQVPFLYVSGSNFEEIFVGLGASRVLNVFAAATRSAPCLIFIDEIDSVGRNRTSSPHHPYANQTINQLLAEMDGFEASEGIIILGATNQAGALDEALLRPGRFDLQIHVSPPTLEGRIALLNLYLKKVKTASDLDIERLAHSTVGYTGADIQNLVNQAAISAGLKNDPVVRMDHLWEARDRLLMGPAKKKPQDELTNRVSAYHEAGHALVALLTPDSTPLHKVTIIPRGLSGGHSSFVPDKDRSFMTRSQLLAQLDVMMGGRVGEEVAFGMEKVTTGAGDDFRKATELAQNMVSRFGLSSKLGARVVVDMSDNQLSPNTRDLIDKEVDQLLNDSLSRTRALLTSHAKQHKALAEALLYYETLSKEEVDDVLSGKLRPPKHPPPPPVPSIPTGMSSKNPTVSQIPV